MYFIEIKHLKKENEALRCIIQCTSRVDTTNALMNCFLNSELVIVERSCLSLQTFWLCKSPAFFGVRAASAGCPTKRFSSRPNVIFVRGSCWPSYTGLYCLVWRDSGATLKTVIGFFMSLTQSFRSQLSLSMRGSLWPSCVDRVHLGCPPRPWWLLHAAQVQTIIFSF